MNDKYLPFLYAKPHGTQLPNTYQPTIIPLSLMPSACVDEAPGKLTVLKLPARYVNAVPSVKRLLIERKRKYCFDEYWRARRDQDIIIGEKSKLTQSGSLRVFEAAAPCLRTLDAVARRPISEPSLLRPADRPAGELLLPAESVTRKADNLLQPAAGSD